MGLFDSVRADCPACETEASIEFQSKAGDCSMRSYDRFEVPTAIAADIHGEEAFCRQCGQRWMAKSPSHGFVSIRIQRSPVH